MHKIIVHAFIVRAWQLVHYAKAPTECINFAEKVNSMFCFVLFCMFLPCPLADDYCIKWQSVLSNTKHCGLWGIAAARESKQSHRILHIA